VPSGMTMVSAIFSARRFWNQNLYCDAKRFCKTLVMKNMRVIFNLNKIVSNFQFYSFFCVEIKFSKENNYLAARSEPGKVLQYFISL
jgi:hypothetical protein